MAGDEPEKGDKVSWNWGGGAPGGKVAEKKTEGEIAITSKRGNKIKKNAEPDNPAVHIERSGNDVVKKASELNVEKKASGNSSGDKRKHDETEQKEEPLTENAEGKEIKPGGKDANKKQKAEKEKEKEKAATKDEKKETNGEDAASKKRGRPKKGEGNTKTKKKDVKPRSTEGIGSRTRSQNK